MNLPGGRRLKRFEYVHTQVGDALPGSRSGRQNLPRRHRRPGAPEKDRVDFIISRWKGKLT